MIKCRLVGRVATTKFKKVKKRMVPAKHPGQRRWRWWRASLRNGLTEQTKRKGLALYRVSWWWSAIRCLFYWFYVIFSWFHWCRSPSGFNMKFYLNWGVLVGNWVAHQLWHISYQRCPSVYTLTGKVRLNFKAQWQTLDSPRAPKIAQDIGKFWFLKIFFEKILTCPHNIVELPCPRGGWAEMEQTGCTEME